LRERPHFLDHGVAMGEVRGRGPGHAVDLIADPGEAILHTGNDALDLLRAIAGILGAQRRLAALVDQAADMAVQPAYGIADLKSRLPGGLREAFHLAGDH